MFKTYTHSAVQCLYSIVLSCKAEFTLSKREKSAAFATFLQHSLCEENG